MLLILQSREITRKIVKNPTQSIFINRLSNFHFIQINKVVYFVSSTILLFNIIILSFFLQFLISVLKFKNFKNFPSHLIKEIQKLL